MRNIISREIQNDEAGSKRIGFDYSILSPSQLTMVQQKTLQIRNHLGRNVAHMIEAGVALNAVKQLLPHGQFRSWLRTEFDWHERTAARYMAAARMLGGRFPAVLDLEVNVIHKLAARSTPALIRSEILLEIEKGRRPSLSEIHTRIQHAIKTEWKPASTEATPELQCPMRKAATAAFQAPDTLDRGTAMASQRAAELILERLGAIDKYLLDLLQGADAEELLRTLINGTASRIAG